MCNITDEQCCDHLQGTHQLAPICISWTHIQLTQSCKPRFRPSLIRPYAANTWIDELLLLPNLHRQSRVSTPALWAQASPAATVWNFSEKPNEGKRPAYIIHSIVQQPYGHRRALTASASASALPSLINFCAWNFTPFTSLASSEYQVHMVEAWSVFRKALGASSAARGRLVSEPYPSSLRISPD